MQDLLVRYALCPRDILSLVRSEHDCLPDPAFGVLSLWLAQFGHPMGEISGAIASLRRDRLTVTITTAQPDNKQRGGKQQSQKKPWAASQKLADGTKRPGAKGSLAILLWTEARAATLKLFVVLGGPVRGGQSGRAKHDLND